MKAFTEMKKVSVVWLLCWIWGVHPVRADYSLYEAYDSPVTVMTQEAQLPGAYAFLPLLLTDCDNTFTGRFASGAWALSVPVAVHYGLLVNDTIDERRNPILATRAATRYLKDLRTYFDGNDTLVLRQYTLCMPLLRVGADSLLWALEKTENEYRRGERTSSFLEPLSVAHQEAERRDSLLREQRRKRAEEIAQRQAKDKPSYIIYKVRSGDYLGRIAQRNHVTVRQLMQWNNLRSDFIREGQKLKIYK